MSAAGGAPGPPLKCGDDAVWNLVNDMMGSRKHLVQHQIESMNDFYDRQIPQVLRHFNRIDVGVGFDPLLLEESREVMSGFRRKLTMRMSNPVMSYATIEEPSGRATPMTPHLARLRSYTYSAPLHVDIHIAFEYVNDDNVRTTEDKKLKHVFIGRVPIMVGSRPCRIAAGATPGVEECRHDIGGYFVVNGLERVIISTDRIADNKALVFGGSRAHAGLEADIRSVAYDCLVPQKLTLRLDHKKANKYGRPIVAVMRSFRGDIPLFVLFRALGVESDRDIFRYILGGTESVELENELVASAQHAADAEAHTRERARALMRSVLNLHHYARRYGYEWAYHEPNAMWLLDKTIAEELLPHVGPNPRDKAMFLGHMAGKLLRVAHGLLPPDNRDTYLNKRVETPGVEFTTLFRTQFNKLVNDCVSKLTKLLNDNRPELLMDKLCKEMINTIIRSSTIEGALMRALSTGNFGSKQLQVTSRTLQGLSQIANRMNYMALLSHLRRFMSQIERNGKMVAPRKLDVSHYGIICPSETPEGAQVGIVKNMSIACAVSIAHNPASARALVARFVTAAPPPSDAPRNSPEARADREAMRAYLGRMGPSTRVFFNGALLGYSDDPHALVAAMREHKLRGDVPPMTSIVWRPRDRTVALSLESGRCCRPLFVVGSDGRALWDGGGDFEEQVKRGAIEFVDVEESDTAMIAMEPADLTKPALDVGGTILRPRYTHQEIHPCLALGVLANNIPFANCNQSPRNVYQCLWEEEPVMLADGSWRPIRDVAVGDAVATFDPDTCAAGVALVSATLRAPTDKPMVDLTTLGGRAIRLTADHRVLVLIDGFGLDWMEAGQVGEALARGERVLVATFAPPTPDAAYAAAGFAYALGAAGGPARPHAVSRAGVTKARSWLAGVVGAAAMGAPFCPEGHEDREDLQAVVDVADCGCYLDSDDQVRVRHAAKGEFVAKAGACALNRAALAGLVRDAEAFRGDADTVARGDAMFVPVAAVAPCATTDFICDLSVDGPTHCFVAGRGGGFGVHNSAMGKQAMGVYATSFNHRMDSSAHLLHSPQQPLIGTRMASILGQNDLPNGQNVVVAIMSMPQNQEDSVIINSAAIDRGLFTSTYTKVFREKLLKNNSTGEEEYLKGVQPKEARAYKSNYTKLGPEGYPPRGTSMRAGDVLIGKVMPHNIGNSVVAEDDNSLVLNKNDFGIVQSVHHDPTETDGEGLRFIKVQLRSTRRPKVGDKFSCYSPDHDVLTTDGWVPVADVTVAHKVATLSDDGQALVYRHPTEVQAYDYEGNMYHVESNQVDLLVTPNHRMWVQKVSTNAVYGAEKAEDILGMRRFYKKDVNVWTPDWGLLPEVPHELVTEGEGAERQVTGFRLPGDGTPEQPDLIVPVEPFLTFFGIWMAEGCITSRNWAIDISAHKPRVKAALTDICAEGKLNFKIHKHMELPTDTEPQRWCVPIKQLVNFILPYNVGSVNKYWPEWAWYLSREQCRTFISGILLGDGSSWQGAGAQNAGRRLYTSSTRSADGFQRLCLHAGYSSNKIVRYEAGHQSQPVKATGEVITSTADAYHMSVIESQNEPKVNKYKTGSGPTAANMQDKWEPYNGKVHCCTVPGPGVIYVRRNGYPVWCGNSRHAQKGTLGEIRPVWDMPSTKDGIRPDVVLNPHAIPSRMTIAQLQEMLLGKAVALDGRFGDGTPFTGRDVVAEAGAVLERHGYQRHGDEILYDGRTGAQIRVEIFVGIPYYQRLKHCSDDKIHSRGSNGPVQISTHQPNEGRARGGGLRLGEMERDCILSQGSASFLKERMLDVSDNFRIFVCKRCGMPATANQFTGRIFCPNRKCGGEVYQIRIPFACNLMDQELMAIGVAMRLKL